MTSSTEQRDIERRRIRLRTGALAAAMIGLAVVAIALAHGPRIRVNPAAYPAMAASRVIALAAMLEETCARPFDYLNSQRIDG